MDYCGGGGGGGGGGQRVCWPPSQIIGGPGPPAPPPPCSFAYVIENQARPEMHRTESASLAIAALFLVLPDKLDIKKTVTWDSLFSASVLFCKSFPQF